MMLLNCQKFSIQMLKEEESLNKVIDILLMKFSMLFKVLRSKGSIELSKISRNLSSECPFTVLIKILKNLSVDQSPKKFNLLALRTSKEFLTRSFYHVKVFIIWELNLVKIKDNSLIFILRNMIYPMFLILANFHQEIST